MKKQIEELERLFSIKVGEDVQEEYKNYLSLKGASAENLQEIETLFDIKLPEDFKEFYRYKNGSGYHFHILYPEYGEGCIEPFYLYSLDVMKETKGYFCDNDELLSEYYDEQEISHLDARIKPYLFNKKWFPFAQLAGGSLYLMLDYDPASDGKTGQIIAYVHDPDFIYYVADSFTNLVKHSNINLQDWEEIDY
ncbi:SMI1/KNR4 family protein [Brevibacillus laterosporus]|uniref:SMI1/KNR4 family protein n=1 Tax=Brevibacillus laterosporus TaxID=1465 RepID=UPI003D24A8FE